MLMFWFFLGCLSLIALGFLCIPLAVKNNKKSIDHAELSLSLYKQRLDHLQLQKQLALIDAADYQQDYLALQKTLLDEVPVTLDKVVAAKPSLVKIIAFASIFLISSFSLYWKLGASTALSDYQLSQHNTAVTTAEIAKLGSLENIIQRLKQQVEKSPDAKGWFLLGRLYLKSKQFDLAINAFQQADQLLPDQPELLISYAEAIYLQNKGALTSQAIQLLQRVLKLQPLQPDALNLLAIDAFQHKKFSQAIYYWEQLLPQFPPNTAAGKNLLQLIAVAQKNLNLQHTSP